MTRSRSRLDWENPRSPLLAIDMAAAALKVVYGTQLKAKIDFWSGSAPHRVASVEDLMLSYAEIAARPRFLAESAMSGLRRYLGFKGRIYLDNGSFTVMRTGAVPD